MVARIAVLTAGGSAPAIIINALAKAYPDLTVIMEPPEPKPAFLKRRTRALGWFSVAGQLPMLFGSRFSKRFLQARFAELERDYGNAITLSDEIAVRTVPSANDPACIQVLRDLAPDLLFVVGARMLKADTLNELGCPAINFHAGMTPHYRGVNCGYWALAEGNPDLYGGTVHFIDAGVDTGTVIAQKVCEPGPADTLFSHHHVITAQCAALCVASVEEALAGRVMEPQPTGPSRQYYHPTVWGWIATGWRHHIW